ncbi:MAG: homoserine dehydrogenase, partial [Aureliella sp.]
GQYQLSIASLIQHEPDEQTETPMVPLVIMTHEAPEGAARKAVEKISQLGVVSGPSVRMRVMDERS